MTNYKPVSYFENILKKRKFNMSDIAIMKPSYIHPYSITGKINRDFFIRNFDKINKLRHSMMPNSKPFK